MGMEMFPRLPQRRGLPLMPKVQTTSLQEMHDALPRNAITYRDRGGGHSDPYRNSTELDSLRVRLATPYVSPYASMTFDQMPRDTDRMGRTVREKKIAAACGPLSC